MNRNEAIQATNLTEFPFTWLESGTIDEIIGGDSLAYSLVSRQYISAR